MKATVQIEIGSIANRSVLEKLFAQTPFKVLDITEDKRNNPLHLMLMSSSPGIMDGDVYDLNIKLAKGASLQLHTQAYQRIFQMKSTAAQSLEITLQEGASFCFLPHPTVPHHLSSFTNRNHFYLGNNCRFVYGEILTCGRKLNGEAFRFTKYHSITNLFLNNKLVVKENLLVMPKEIDVNAMGQLEGFTHQASFIFLQSEINTSVLREGIASMLALEQNLEFGISTLPINGLIIRMLGQGAEQLFDCMQRINNMLPAHIVKSATYAS